MIKNFLPAIREWIIEQKPTVFLTHNFGYQVKPINGERPLKGFYNRIERKINGRNWHQKSSEERIRVIGVWEHLESNPHCHTAVAGPKGILKLEPQIWKEIWVELQPRGELHIEHIVTQEAVANYITKDIWREKNSDRLFLYAPTYKLKK